MPEVVVIKEDILNEVFESNYDDVLCIKLSFENNDPKYKAYRFTGSSETYKLAETLVGHKVQVIAWDPDGKPGKWSDKGWFKDVFSIYIIKGSCSICGVADHLLTFSEDFGKSWMHYSCKFPV